MALFYAEQKRRVRNDGTYTTWAIVGSLLFLWPLAFLALGNKGDGEAADRIAALKGEILEIEYAMGRCSA